MSSITDLLPEVRDQGYRSTCLSIALSDGHLVARGVDPALSAEFLHFHATKRAGVGLNDAIPISAGCEALNTDGQPSEEACPYSPAARALGWTPPANLSPIWRRGTTTPNADLLNLVRENLKNGKSCVLIIRTNDAFTTGPASGASVFDFNGPDRSFHAVLAVECKTAPDEIRIRNCWGPNWGENGYAWVGEAYLSARCVAIVRFTG